ncbi:hypothetical protein P3T16_003475 [Paraburkholderia sp. GAS42]|jgi:hypothetical protein
MRPEHLKLATIVTMVCGAMSSLGANAAGSESPGVATGRIVPMRDPALDAALHMTDDVVQDTASVTPDDARDGAQAQDASGAPVSSAAPVAQEGTAPEVVYAARTVVLSTLDVAPVTSAVSDSSRVPEVPAVSTSTQDVALAMSDVPDSTRVPEVQAVSMQEQDVARVTGDMPDSAYVPEVPAVSTQAVAPQMNDVPDSAYVQDVPAVSAQDVAPVAAAVPDSGQVQVQELPAVSAQNGVPTTNAVPVTARAPTVSVKVVVPVMSAVPDSAYVPEAPARSARQAVSADSTPSSDLVHAAHVPAVSTIEPAPVTAGVTLSVVTPEPGRTVAPAKDVAPAASHASPQVTRTADLTIAPAMIAMPAPAHAVQNVARPTEVAAAPASSGGLLDRAALNLKVKMDAPVQSAQHAPLAGTGQVLEATAGGKTATPHAAQKRDEADPAWASADLVAVDESRLDSMRGGFELPSGLVVSFGISRAAFVNGNLVSSTSFNIPNIAQMTPQQAQMLANANTGALVQNGLNNTVQPGALPGVTGAVIQNTMSNQQIQALTTINTSVNSLSAFKSMNIGATLNSALISAVRPR